MRNLLNTKKPQFLHELATDFRKSCSRYLQDFFAIFQQRLNCEFGLTIAVIDSVRDIKAIM